MSDYSSRAEIASYIQRIADWRRQRAEEMDRDARNLQSAADLDGLAAFVRALPDGDERISALVELAFSSAGFEPGQRVHAALGLYHYHHTETSEDAFLTHLVELQREDVTEAGNFGGRFAQDDNPWSRRQTTHES